jgi:hypothetical protein
MQNKQQKMWQKKIVEYFGLLSLHILKATGKNNQKIMCHYSRTKGRYWNPWLDEIFIKLCRIMGYNCSCFADSRIKTSQQNMAVSLRIPYPLRTENSLTSQGMVYDNGWLQRRSLKLPVKCIILVDSTRMHIRLTVKGLLKGFLNNGDA